MFTSRIPAGRRLGLTLTFLGILSIWMPSMLMAGSAANGEALELRGHLVDGDGVPLHGPQNVVLRFFEAPEDEDSALVVEHTLRPIVVDQGSFRLSLAPDRASDGPAPGFYLSPAELFQWREVVWMEIIVDERWRSQRVAVTARDKTIERWHEETTEPPDHARQRWIVRQTIATPTAEPREAIAKAISSDPSEHTEYGGLCLWKLTCGGIQGRMKWTPDGPGCFSDALPSMPLTVILHGNGYGHDDYDYLQDHLAQNGILSASINVVSTCGGAGPGCAAAHQDVADDAETYLMSGCFETHFLDKFVSPTPVDFHRTAVVGHSRGGESARYLASTLDARPDFTVRAVTALAPTRHTSQPIYGTSTAAYMLLYGSLDFDVPAEQAFPAHDFAGWNEWSTPSAFDVDRVMKLFSGGSHGAFADIGLGPFAGSQRTTTRGYVNAFLRAWLLGDWSFYETFIRGRDKPGTYGSEIFTQYSSSISRRVVDNFQDGTLTPNTLGGTVTTYNMNLAAALDAETIAETPHAGWVLRVRPSQSGAYVRWNVPAAQQNANAYFFLSVRLGQLDGGGPTGARLWIRNAGVYSWVDLADYGGIPEPAGSLAQMHTVRVPFADFGAHNAVEAVYLQFNNASGINKRFIVDNLEFAQSLVIAP